MNKFLIRIVLGMFFSGMLWLAMDRYIGPVFKKVSMSSLSSEEPKEAMEVTQFLNMKERGSQLDQMIKKKENASDSNR